MMKHSSRYKQRDPQGADDEKRSANLALGVICETIIPVDGAALYCFAGPRFSILEELVTCESFASMHSSN